MHQIHFEADGFSYCQVVQGVLGCFAITVRAIAAEMAHSARLHTDGPFDIFPHPCAFSGFYIPQPKWSSAFHLYLVTRFKNCQRCWDTDQETVKTYRPGTDPPSTNGPWEAGLWSQPECDGVRGGPAVFLVGI